MWPPNSWGIAVGRLPVFSASPPDPNRQKIAALTTGRNGAACAVQLNRYFFEIYRAAMVSANEADHVSLEVLDGGASFMDFCAVVSKGAQRRDECEPIARTAGDRMG